MPGPSLSVLIVDDQPPVVEALQVLFDLHGIDHRSASTPKEALRVAAGETLGAVVQDMNFDRTDTSGDAGVELFRALRETQPGVPILLMTAWASLETAVQLVKEGAADYIEKPWNDDKLVTAVKNLVRMRALELENDRLRSELHKSRQVLADEHDLCGIVYASEAMHNAASLAVQVAASDAPVLITGPSGSGKERLAEIVQANSRRRDGPFVRVNVGAIPDELMESELFGAEPGAYTGAEKRRIGHFETASGGTLFLDEIDALSLGGQVKLLRVLQAGEFHRLGSSQTRRVDVRVISATNATLLDAIESGSFREDLYYRLNVVELRVPALAARTSDVLPLARHFLARFAEENGRARRELEPAAEDALLAHAWPGNVRELENRVRRAIVVGTADCVSAQDLGLAGPAEPRPAPAGAARSEGVERADLIAALSRAGGVVSRAADEMGISRQALYRRMARLDIELERRPKD